MIKNFQERSLILYYLETAWYGPEKGAILPIRGRLFLCFHLPNATRVLCVVWWKKKGRREQIKNLPKRHDGTEKGGGLKRAT